MLQRGNVFRSMSKATIVSYSAELLHGRERLDRKSESLSSTQRSWSARCSRGTFFFSPFSTSPAAQSLYPTTDHRRTWSKGRRTTGITLNRHSFIIGAGCACRGSSGSGSNSNISRRCAALWVDGRTADLARVALCCRSGQAAYEAACI